MSSGLNDTFHLFLKEKEKSEQLIVFTKDPLRVHRILTGKSFSRRVSKFGNTTRVTKNKKDISFGNFQRLCLNEWLKRAEGT